MANYSTNLKDWGATGEEYPSGYKQVVQEEPVAEWHNFLFNNTIEDLQHLIGLTNERIESDKGVESNRPSSPETSHIYHNQDTNRLEEYDSSASAWYDHLRRQGDSMEGALDMAGHNIDDSVGTLTLGSDANVTGQLTEQTNRVATRTWVDNNADVPNADYADNAGQLGGEDPSYYTTLTEVNNNADVPNADHADNADQLGGLTADQVERPRDGNQVNATNPSYGKFINPSSEGFLYGGYYRAINTSGDNIHSCTIQFLDGSSVTISDEHTNTVSFPTVGNVDYVDLDLGTETSAFGKVWYDSA